MIINKAILHILDFNSDVCVFSQKVLNFANVDIHDYLEKHLSKLISDANQRPGTFKDDSRFKGHLKNYLEQTMDFVELSTLIGNSLHEQIMKSDSQDSTDLLIVDFNEEDVRYFAVLLLTNKVSFTHQVSRDGEFVQNEIIRHYSILPGPSHKIDAYALINLRNLAVRFVDKKRSINGEDVFILPDLVLQCGTEISTKETIKLVKKITDKVAIDHGANTTATLSKVKNYIVENSETSETLSPYELGREVFADSPNMLNEYESKVREAQLPEKINVEKAYALRTGRNHKIKTDTGIEVTFPADYFENSDFIEFVNNPDGTISIQLKNIGKIINK